MTRLRSAIAWWCFIRGGMAPETLVRVAAEIGYEGMELAEEEYWPLITAHGLKIASARAHSSQDDALNRRENHARIAREVEANIALATRWGVTTLICFSGNRNGLVDRTGAEITAEGLQRVAKQAEDAGIQLVLELLNSKVNHPDYQCDRTGWGIDVCRMVDSPNVKLLYDVYHMQVMEGDVIRTIRDNHTYFGHYHIAGNPGRNEPDETQELNYPAILAAIRATGFDGFVGMEFLPKGDPIAALTAAFGLYNTSST